MQMQRGLIQLVSLHLASPSPLRETATTVALLVPHVLKNNIIIIIINSIAAATASAKSAAR